MTRQRLAHAGQVEFAEWTLLRKDARAVPVEIDANTMTRSPELDRTYGLTPAAFTEAPPGSPTPEQPALGARSKAEHIGS